MEHSKAIDQSATEAAKAAEFARCNDELTKKSDTRFKLGNSGKPKGARHKTTVAAEALLEGQAEAVIRKLIEVALRGDPTALKLCVERIYPVRKGRTVEIDLPKLKTAGDAKTALSLLVSAVGAGEITTIEAEGLATLLEIWRRTHDTADLAAKVAVLEAMTRRGVAPLEGREG